MLDTITNDGLPHKYFHVMLNMADDDLDPFEYRLLGHYHRVTWNGAQPCREGIRTTATLTGMSVNKVRDARYGLRNKGYIVLTESTIEQQKTGAGATVHLVDLWQENIARYSHPVSNSIQVGADTRVKCDTGGVSNLTPIKIIREDSREDSIGIASAMPVAHNQMCIVHCQESHYDLYIGRGNKRAGLAPSKWANPYPITKTRSRDESIRLFREYILQKPNLLRDLPELRGKVLGCWCKSVAAPDTACHGDILMELAALPDAEIEALAVAAEQRSHNPLFDAVAEYIFEINPAEVNGTGGRIAPIAAWLAGKSDGIRRGSKRETVGFISAPAQPEHVRRFAEDWPKEHGDAALPLDFVKFVEAWRKWASARRKPVSTVPAHSAPGLPPPVELTDEQRARQLAELRAARKEMGL